ncbi:hypothetical protein LUZ63_004376 [Rhynchospora breviuscula]|uniref:Protein kinase domain-containing protein n=1 Tax=Rhynchospora breviuscula TaxID=2022672 RepID=A0A9Q0D2E7_9POAL|nr:hypothetical protein LUZ63_004376 [Rhynchospora breviuscula]
MGIPESESESEKKDMGEEEEEKGALGMESGEEEEIKGKVETATTEKKKTVVVAVKMDSQSKEILTWSLVNLAHAGDHFVACHVITSPAASCSSLNLELDSMLAVYEGFCNLKQIELKLKICRGFSVRRALVREANSLGASNLILGVVKHNLKNGYALSIPKYCARKLRSTCSVVAVNSGKIVFQSEIPDKTKPDEGITKESDLYCVLPARYLSTSNSNATNNSDVTLEDKPEEHVLSKSDSDGGANANHPICTSNNGNNDLYCPWPNENTAQVESRPTSQLTNEDLYCSWPRDGEANKVSSSTNRSGSGTSNQGCSVCTISSEDESSNSSSCNSPSESNKKLNGGSHNLRKRVLTHRRCHSSEWPVVRWAMRLPTRLHLDGRPVDPVKCGVMSLSNDFSLTEDWPPKELKEFEEKFSSFCKNFRFEELEKATSNFSADKLIGKGGTSRVYKATFSDGRDLAVKMLKPSNEALKEFMCEVEIASCLHHKNIITLDGFCFENRSLILVYDYLSNGSLEEILHGEREKKDMLSWEERYKIAVGIGEALDYLHSGGGSNESVIHGDVKSSNILLSKDMDTKLSDFGFARRVSSPASNLACNDIAGTFGYLAPEYFMYGKVNEKIDVYAYGVVLLELISGRKPIQAGSPKGHESIVPWAKLILQGGNMEELLDPCLSNAHVAEQMRRITMAASLCLRTSYQCRPTMSIVVKLLQGDEAVTRWAELQVAVAEENLEMSDDEVMMTPSHANIRSYLNLALLDLEDDSVSVASTEQTVDSVSVNASIEDYLDRWSRSSSFE